MPNLVASTTSSRREPRVAPTRVARALGAGIRAAIVSIFAPVVNTLGATDFWLEIDTALKSLLGDADWLVRYARTASGEVMPEALIRDRIATYVEPEILYREADVISLHVPLTRIVSPGLT